MAPTTRNRSDLYHWNREIVSHFGNSNRNHKLDHDCRSCYYCLHSSLWDTSIPCIIYRYSNFKCCTGNEGGWGVKVTMCVVSPLIRKLIIPFYGPFEFENIYFMSLSNSLYAMPLIWCFIIFECRWGDRGVRFNRFTLCDFYLRGIHVRFRD